jgi:hypothetical protein|tara:strand:+ start:3011 stop:3541 length:531 start_codon:yes stop_codon:yes gene_type:complete
MSCSILSTGRNLPCIKSVGGVKSIILADFGTLGNLSVTGAEVTAISTTPAAYKYLVKPGSSGMEETITASAENGTVYYDQNVTVQLQKLDKLTQAELQDVVKGNPHVFVEDFNSNTFLVGAYNGADVSAGTIGTGTALADFTGFNLTFTAQEQLPAFFCASAVVSALQIGAAISPV